MYKDKFVLSIIHDGHPVKEFGGIGNKRVTLPFDSEYKIRLKNKNNKGCTARVFIDDKQVSKLGDLIINANGTIDLERFVDSSLEHGKKFKFVSLDHPDVDDPTSSKNGIIKVEFRLAKKENSIKINIDQTYKPWNWDDWKYTEFYKPWNFTTGDFIVYSDNNTGTLRNSGGPVQCSFSSDANFISENITNTDLEDGATVEGRHSDQSFVYSNLDVEDFATILQLKIVGIKDSKESDSLMYKYCSNCGNKVKRSDKFCSECGNRL